MNVPAASTVNATPGDVARSITRAWLAYFIVVSIIGMVLSFVIGGIFTYVATSMMGSPMMMRMSIWVVSIIVNAPISYLVFQWAVRSKVLPAVIVWNVGGEA
jgi:hypothetical protein